MTEPRIDKFFDDEAKVWVATSPDLPGLVTEAETLLELEKKLPDIIKDLTDV
jgi:predicted RNase H-like HicB family nuclease